MSEKLFFSQDILDAWCEEEKVQVDGEVLSINRNPPVKFQLVPAYRIICIAEGCEDTNKWVNKVKTRDELESAGADVYMNSVLVGDAAYDTEYGYLAEPMKSTKKEEKSDESLLTDFFLKNL